MHGIVHTYIHTFYPYYYYVTYIGVKPLKVHQGLGTETEFC